MNPHQSPIGVDSVLNVVGGLVSLDELGLLPETWSLLKDVDDGAHDSRALTAEFRQAYGFIYANSMNGKGYDFVKITQRTKTWCSILGLLCVPDGCGKSGRSTGRRAGSSVRVSASSKLDDRRNPRATAC